MVNLANRALIWIKSTYFRITLTRTTLAFFLFTFAYCFAHAIVQSFLFELDSDASSLTSMIISSAQIPRNEFAWLSQSRNQSTGKTIYTLKICNAIPFEKSKEDDPCVIIFESNNRSVPEIPNGLRKRQPTTLGSNAAVSPESSVPTGHLASNIKEAFIQPIIDPSSNTVSGVSLTNMAINDGEPIELDAQCTRALLYADQVLKNSRREEWALIGSEFWLLWTSVFAILYGSIAHLYSVVAFRVLSVGWSAYSIWRTHDIDQRFDALITNGACGVDLFPEYFKPRITIQIADLALNVVALLLLSYLVVRLVKTYTSCMFRCVGPPEHVVRIYKFILGLFTCLQVSVYLLITFSALWLDQLLNGAIASISSHMSLYITLFVVTLALLLPWIAIGWRSVRLEQPRLLLLFIGIGLLFEAGWSLMYDALVWRWTWIQWPFFASVAVASQIVVLACIFLSIVCRLNFGKGLKEYLQAASALEKEDFEPEIFESSDRKFSTASDDGWEADIEKRVADRLSQTLDFGAHQPTPPVSPPSYGITFIPPRIPEPAPLALNLVARTYPPSNAQPSGHPNRPQSFSNMVPMLPTLDKLAPWSFPEEESK